MSERKNDIDKPRHKPPRFALAREEAADSIGISLSTFEEYVQPNVRLIQCGRRVLVPSAELERWVKENARSPL